jgi:hypothetical protein
MTIRSTFLQCLLSVLPPVFAAEPGDSGGSDVGIRP